MGPVGKHCVYQTQWADPPSVYDGRDYPSLPGWPAAPALGGMETVMTPAVTAEAARTLRRGRWGGTAAQRPAGKNLCTYGHLHICGACFCFFSPRPMPRSAKKNRHEKAVPRRHGEGEVGLALFSGRSSDFPGFADRASARPPVRPRRGTGMGAGLGWVRDPPPPWSLFEKGFYNFIIIIKKTAELFPSP